MNWYKFIDYCFFVINQYIIKNIYIKIIIMVNIASNDENDIAEQLAFNHTLEELSNTSYVLSTISELEGEIHPKVELLKKAVLLVTNEVFYIFEGTDELASELWDGDENGVSIYKRIWNKTESYSIWLCSINDALDKLNELDIKDVITWTINDKFLDISSEFDVKHDDMYLKITRSILEEGNIAFLEKNDINVKILSILV